MLIPLASTVADVAASVAAVATVGLFIAACYAGRIASRQLGKLDKQIADQGKTEGRRRVFEHLKQLFDRDFIKMDTEAQRLFKARPKDPAEWEALWAAKTDAEKFRIAAAMNFYEVLAGDYNDPEGEVLDRATADKALAYIADAMWVQAQPFVYWLREDFGNERAYVEWEQLHRTFTQTARAAEQPSLAQAAPQAQTRTATTAVQASNIRSAATPSTQGAAAEPTTAPPTSPTPPAPTPPASQDNCPDDPCVAMPRRVLVVALLWTVAIVAIFFCYVEIDAVADFFPAKIGSLPFSAIWFGAVGGLLVSLEGIFEYNRRWLRSYDLWHYLRPLLGAIMGTLGCLIFIVLSSAATSSATTTPNATFYAVIALALGYREKNFRELLMRLIDTIVVPPQNQSEASTKDSTT